MLCLSAFETRVLKYILVGCLWLFTIYKRCPEILNVAGSTVFIQLKAPLK